MFAVRSPLQIKRGLKGSYSGVPDVNQTKDNRRNKGDNTDEDGFNSVHSLPPVPDAPVSVPPIHRPVGVLPPQDLLIIHGGRQALCVG